jgi:branched-subunit amino acid aminotransferase/4-amino-4-deoxychorismate lyase
MADILIETVRIIDGEAPLWPLHRWRLMNSALILGLPLPEFEVPKGGDDRVLRIEFSAEGVHITEREIGSVEPLTLATSPVPHRGYPHKTTNRAWLDAARATGRTTGADDALLFDAEGRLIEATHWAVGWWEGESLCFPPLALQGLKSVARARLTEMVRSGVREAVLTRDELGKRSFVACNAARGVVSVGILDGTVIPENPRTAALAKRFWDRPPA